MNEHRTMNTIVHNALRRDMSRIRDALAAFPTGSQRRADQLGAAWANLADQLRHHHEDEEAIFWPLVRQVGRIDTVMGELEREHQAVVAALDTADDAMMAFVAEPSSDALKNARSAIAKL